MSPGTVASVPPSEVHGAYARAGTQLTVALDEALSSDTSVPGEPVQATVRSNLIADDGSVLVPAGARVLAHVAKVENGGNPHIVLHFDSVQTRLGMAPLLADIRAVHAGRTPEVVVESGILSAPPTPDEPEGVPLTLAYPGASPTLVLPLGTTIRLELTRPLFPPGTVFDR